MFFTPIGLTNDATGRWARGAQILCCALVAWGGVQALPGGDGRRDVPAPVASAPAALVGVPTAESAELAELDLGFSTIEVIVRRNDTLDRIFRRLELSVRPVRP